MVNKKKTTLFVFGCIAIAITALLLIYGILVATGVVHLKQNKLIFAAGSAEKYYDGTPLTADGWTLESGKLQSGHRVEATVNGSQTLPGKGANNMVATIFDENNVDVTDEYVIEYVPGVLYVRGISLLITSGSAIKEYDGKPLIKPESHLAAGQPLSGHKISHRAVGTITNIGKTENIIEVEIIDVATGADMSHFYEITFEYGMLEVTKTPITLVTKGDSKDYDGKPLTNSDYYLVGTLRPGHVANVDVIGTITNVGMEENRAVIKITDNATGDDVTNMYEITYDLGTLTVTGDMQGGGSGGGSGSGSGAGGGGGTLGGAEDINQGDSSESTVDFLNFTSTKSGNVLLRMGHYGDYILSG